MSDESNFKWRYGEIQVVDSFFAAHDSITMIARDRLLSEEERTKMAESVQELRRLALNNPLTGEGLRDLHRHRWMPPPHNIPVPRTEAGNCFRLLVDKWRKDRAGKLIEYMDFSALELRLMNMDSVPWTRHDCYWNEED